MLSRRRDATRRIVVLEAIARPKGTTEYVDQVITHADSRFEFRYLTPRTALQRTDVFHVHWPELIWRGRTTAETLVRCLGTRLVLGLMRLRGTAIVRTLHNLEPHEQGGAVERWILAHLDARTDVFVSINPITQAPDGDAMLIPHGHYRESFAPHPKPNPVEGRIVFAGLIRPYKGIEGLIASFSHTATPGLTLRIVGKPTDELRTMIEVEAAADPRLSVRFGYLPDEEFVAELSSAELVCLPYTNVHNSGTLLAALSLNRPVLVKDSATTRILVEEVGPGWVHLFTGQLASADIDRAVAAVRTVTQRPAPRLDDRDWVCVARRYGNAFIEAMRRAAER